MWRFARCASLRRTFSTAGRGVDGLTGPETGSVRVERVAGAEQAAQLGLLKLRDKQLVLVEGDVQAFSRLVAQHALQDVAAWQGDKQRYGMSVQLLDNIGTVDWDFNLLKPVRCREKKLHPAEDQLMLECSALDKRDLLVFFKSHLQRQRIKASFFDLKNTVHSYRLFSYEQVYKSDKELRGRLYKSFYPPRDQRTDVVEKDEFMDLCVFSPRTHRLWMNIYSPDADLDLQTDSIRQLTYSDRWEYFAMRCLHSLPEFRECRGLDFKTANIERLGLLNEPNPHNGNSRQLPAIASSQRVAYGIVSRSRHELSGAAFGFPKELLEKDFVYPPDLVFETPAGSRPVRIIASIFNVCMLLLEDDCKQHVFESQGCYLHVLLSTAMWPDERT